MTIEIIDSNNEPRILECESYEFRTNNVCNNLVIKKRGVKYTFENVKVIKSASQRNLGREVETSEYIELGYLHIGDHFYLDGKEYKVCSLGNRPGEADNVCCSRLKDGKRKWLDLSLPVEIDKRYSWD